MKFSIIDFEGEHELETSIVPTMWIQMETGQCYWPDQGDSKRAVINCLVPRESWSLYPFKGIKYQTDDYPKAAEKLKLLLLGFSDVGSTSEGDHHGNRPKRLVHKRRYMSSSDSDEDQAGFSLQHSKRSCVDKNTARSQRPTLEFTPPLTSTQPLTVKRRAATRLLSPQARPETQLPQTSTLQPLNARPPLARSPCMSPQPAASTSMQTLDDLSETGSGSVKYIYTLLHRIVNKIEEQNEVQQNMFQKQNQLMLLFQNMGQDPMGTAAMPEGLSLPLTNDLEVGKLEEELLEKEFRTKLVQHLSCIGGDSSTSLARRILKRLFSTELAQKYNFSGAKGKKSFQSLQLRSILFAAVRKTFATTEAEVDGIARKWFSNGRDMDGGRIRRAMPSNGIPPLMG